MASPVQTLPVDEFLDLAERRIAVDSTLGTTLAEGVSPSPEVLVLFESYARGEIGLDEILPSVQALHER